jgi:hypothetical protein
VKILTAGICKGSCGLKFEPDAKIGQKGEFANRLLDFKMIL